MAANTDNIESIAKSAVETLTLPLTLELRTMAMGAKWPAHIVAALTINYEEGELVVDYPEEFEEEINNLEYGDINSLPNPVFRPFVYRVQRDVSKVLEHQSLADLMEMVGVV